MKRLLMFIILIAFCLTGCTTKKKTSEKKDLPFIELSKGKKKEVKKAFLSKEIIRESKFDEYNYPISSRKGMTVEFFENYTESNKDDYHYWLTCYYESEDTIVIHVERSCKGYEGFATMFYVCSYDLGEYHFRVCGANQENFAYILVYKNNSLYEIDYAYDNNLISDDEVSDIYYNYINTKPLKFDPYYIA